MNRPSTLVMFDNFIRMFISLLYETDQSDIDEEESEQEEQKEVKPADQIASEIEQNQDLMDDTPLAEKLRL